MTDHTPFWDQLQAILQDELTVLRNVLSITAEVERAHLQSSASPTKQDIEEAWTHLAAIQQRRFEKTKGLTGCSNSTLQNDYFTKWLQESDDDCETISLWEQVCALLAKIEDQKERNALLPLQVRIKEVPKRVEKKIDTLEKS